MNGMIGTGVFGGIGHQEHARDIFFRVEKIENGFVLSLISNTTPTESFYFTKPELIVQYMIDAIKDRLVKS